MQYRKFDPQPWYLIPVEPGAEASFRRWNLVIITILAALVLALFVSAVVPQTNGSAAHHPPAKIHQTLAPAPIEELQTPV